MNYMFNIWDETISGALIGIDEMGAIKHLDNCTIFL